MKRKYKFLSILSVATMIAGLIPASADSFEGSTDGDYLFLDMDGDKGSAIMRIDGKITFIQGEIKYYKDGNFQIKAIQDRVILLGTFLSDESLRIIIVDRNESKEIILDIQKLGTEYLIPVEQEHIGMEDIRAAEEQLRLEEEKKKQEEEANKVVILRSEYTKSTDKEIAILDQTMDSVSTNDFFGFDIRVVDPNVNNMFSYYTTDGFVNDVEIISIVKDGEGNILNTFTGITTNQGHYSPDKVTYFPDNINTNNAFSLNVLATAYFDDTATFATTELFKEFFVQYYSSDKSVDSYPPTGTISIILVDAEPTPTMPTLHLTCDDYSGCSTMAFALNSTDFTNSTNYGFSETFDYPEELDVGFHTIYVQYTDYSPRENVSTQEISVDYTVCEDGQVWIIGIDACQDLI